jgi:hypothetical protein
MLTALKPGKCRLQVVKFMWNANTSRLTLEHNPSLLSQETPTEVDETQIATPHRPIQFSLPMVVLSIFAFLGVAVTFAVLYVKSKPFGKHPISTSCFIFDQAITFQLGLGFPSENKFVRNLITNYVPTTIAMLIEAGWVFINRLICILQPLEELQGSKARASRSIDLNYNSLPPQLTIFKALRSRHFTLAIVCTMALLTNLLAIAFSGIFIQRKELIPVQTTFSLPFDAKFVSINGSSGPPSEGQQVQSETVYSGAYQGGTGEDQFLLAESNYTQNTSLPAWADAKAMYLPFTIPSTANATHDRFRAKTKFFAAEANCKPMVLGQDYQLQLFANHSDSYDNRPITFNMTVEDEAGKPINCSGNDIDFSVGPASNPQGKRLSGKVSAELVATFTGSPNATQHDQDTCKSAVAIGWMKKAPKDWADLLDATIAEATSTDTFFVRCQPKLVIGDAYVTVDSTGRVQGDTVIADQSAQDLDQYFSNGVENLISQSNLFLFRPVGTGWHNDSYAGEFIPYFINQASKTLRSSDPNEPLPAFSDVDEPLQHAYSKLFAIWLSINKDRLFIHSSSESNAVVGEILTQQDRLFLNIPLFIISETILGTYPSQPLQNHFTN